MRVPIGMTWLAVRISRRRGYDTDQVQYQPGDNKKEIAYDGEYEPQNAYPNIALIHLACAGKKKAQKGCYAGAPFLVYLHHRRALGGCLGSFCGINYFAAVLALNGFEHDFFCAEGAFLHGAHCFSFGDKGKVETKAAPVYRSNTGLRIKRANFPSGHFRRHTPCNLFPLRASSPPSIA